MSEAGICANLSMLFPEQPLLARVDAAAAAGFGGVEVWFPYDTPAGRLRGAVARAGLKLVMINTPPGPEALGGRGCAASPGAQARFREDLTRALDYAAMSGADFLHVMSGRVAADVDRNAARATLVENLDLACEAAKGSGVMLLVEAISPHATPGYFLDRVGLAVGVVREVDRPGLGLLYDDFHAAMIGDAVDFSAIAQVLRHVQVASVPDRAEPKDLAPLLERLDAAGYGGWISGEYTPSGRTLEGLDWMAQVRRWRRAPPIAREASGEPDAALQV